MNKLARLSAIFAISTGMLQTAVAAPLTLEPSSDWTLWARDDVCRVVREFGTGDQKVVVQFEKSGPGSSLSLILAGKPVAFPDRAKDLEAALGPANPVKVHQWLLRGETTGPGALPTIHFGSVGGFFWENDNPQSQAMKLMPKKFSDVSWLSIGYAGGKDTVVMKLQDMREPLSSVRRCTMSLLRSWGFDPDNVDTMPTVFPEPKADAGKWVTSADYPTEALRAGQSAFINFRVMVDASGKPVSCHVQAITIGDSFREITCKSIMRRARFSPALNASGKPVASWYENSVRWITPP
jgi:hypothetical protein